MRFFVLIALIMTTGTLHADWKTNATNSCWVDSAGFEDKFWYCGYHNENDKKATKCGGTWLNFNDERIFLYHGESFEYDPWYKTGSGGKYGTSDASAELFAFVRAILDEGDVVWQTGNLGKVDGGGVNAVARPFVHGKTLSRQSALVKGALTRKENSVHRNTRPGTQDHRIAHLHASRGKGDLHPVAQQHAFIGGEGKKCAHSVRRSALGASFEELAEPHDHGDHRR